MRPQATKPIHVPIPSDAIRKGVGWIVSQVEADIESFDQSEITDGELAEITTALKWLRGVAL